MSCKSVSVFNIFFSWHAYGSTLIVNEQQIIEASPAEYLGVLRPFTSMKTKCSHMTLWNGTLSNNYEEMNPKSI